MKKLTVTLKAKVTTMAKAKLALAVLAKNLGMDNVKSFLVKSARRNIQVVKI